jgi:hypothetical protein
MPSYWSRFTNTIAYVLLSNRSYNFRSHAIIFLQSKLSYRLYRTNAISNAFYKNCHSYYKCVYSSSLVTLCQYLTRFTDFINKYLVNLLRFTLFNVTQYIMRLSATIHVYFSIWHQFIQLSHARPFF